jgi:hypothetical protein
MPEAALEFASHRVLVLGLGGKSGHMDCPPVARGTTRDQLAVHLDLQRRESADMTL